MHTVCSMTYSALQEQYVDHVDRFKTWAQHLAAATWKKPAVLDQDWPIVLVSDAPQQQNFQDCGIFTALMMEYLSSPRSGSFPHAAEMRAVRQEQGGGMAVVASGKQFGWEQRDIDQRRRDIFASLWRSRIV
jgi:Ulp1 family protease